MREVRSDGDAGRPERSKAEDGFDGGPVAAEDGLLMPVVQFHEGILREEEKRGS